MPLALVSRNAAKLPDTTLKSVTERLRILVARALSTKDAEGKLTPQEIEVLVYDFGHLDIHLKDVEIVIWAHRYPEREANLDDRQQAITKGVKRLLPPGISGYVWVLIQPTSFGEF